MKLKKKKTMFRRVLQPEDSETISLQKVGIRDQPNAKREIWPRDWVKKKKNIDFFFY